MNIKYLKYLFVLIAGLAVLPASAQHEIIKEGFAGEDHSILFSKDDPATSKTIELGSWSYQPDCVFYWHVISSPDDAVYSFDYDNAQRPNFTYNKAEGDYVIECTRVSKYGYQREYLQLSILSEIELEDVKTLKACYSINDEVKLEDFRFTTRPEGYEHLIQIEDDDKIVGRNQNAFGDEEVHFYTILEDGEKQKFETTGQIYVSTGDWLDLSITNENLKNLPSNYAVLKQYYEMIKNSDKKFEKVKNIANFLKCAVPPQTPLTTDHKIDINRGIMRINMSCCNDKPTAYFKWTGGVDAWAALQLNVPLWPGIPKTGLSLVGELKAGVKADINVMIATREFLDCFRLNIPIDAYGRVAIGLQVGFLDPDLVSLTGVVYGEVHGGGYFNVIPLGIDFSGIYITGGIQVTGCLLGFNHQFVDLSFGRYYFMDAKSDVL